MGRFSEDGRALVARLRGETIRVEAIGAAIRVRATTNRGFQTDSISALLPSTEAGPATIEVGETTARLSTEALTLDMRFAERGIYPHLLLRVTDRATGRVLLEEEPPHFLWPGARAWTADAGPLWRCETRFRAWDGERFFGMGQHQHGRFDQKGCVIELLQKNTEVVIPLLHSSRGNGLLWNSPGTGRRELSSGHALATTGIRVGRVVERRVTR
jgi:alpha-D-xyloside xylohydrolase